jgi:hypothetical protein
MPYTYPPSIAQLVERWTVDEQQQLSIGRWFKSGSKEIFGGEFVGVVCIARFLQRIGDILSVTAKQMRKTIEKQIKLRIIKQKSNKTKKVIKQKK